MNMEKGGNFFEKLHKSKIFKALEVVTFLATMVPAMSAAAEKAPADQGEKQYYKYVWNDKEGKTEKVEVDEPEIKRLVENSIITSTVNYGAELVMNS